MKILHLPLQVLGSEQVGQATGMREVFDEVVEFDYLNMPKDEANQKLKEIAKQKFDIGWFQLQETNWILPETLKEIKPYFKHLVQWNGDIREVVPEYQQKIGKYFDITYLGFDHIKQYQPYCNELKIMMIAVDPVEVTRHFQKQPQAIDKKNQEIKIEKLEKEYDVIFIGNHYGNQFPDSQFRLDLINLLRGKFNLKVFGFDWPFETETCPVKSQGYYYSRAKVCLSINHFNNVKYYSERLLWCLASGTPCVAKKTPDLEFLEGTHLLPFDDMDECVRLVGAVLDSPHQFDAMASRALSEVIKNHTWTNRFKQLKEDLKCLK